MRASVSSRSSTRSCDEAVLVERADRAALGARAVVGDQQTSVSSSSAARLEVSRRSRPICASVCARKPANTSIMRAKSRRSSAASVAPGGDPRRTRRAASCPRGTTPSSSWRAKARARATPPSRRRSGRGSASIHVARRLVRRVHRAGREVEEERLARRGLLLVLDQADRLVGEVLGEVVAVLGRARRLDEAVVAHQLGRPLVGVAVRGSRSSARSRGRAASARTDPTPLCSQRGARCHLPTANVL